jgi:predicted amidohydrolase YtcJ
VLVGRIVTIDEPAEAEALFIQDGLVAAVGTRGEVLALAGDQVPVIDIGQNVAYPGFIDAHAHWIGDRNYYEIETPAEAMELAAARGWTSISEQWNDQEKLAQLEALAGEDALPLRVDAYLALNALEIGGYYGDWYVDHQRGPVGNRLRIQGLKIHLDSGTGAILYWEPADLVGTIGRAVDAGWQVTVHTVSHEAHELVLGAFEEAIGPNGPNPLHHRIEHALQVTDDQLARMVAMDLALVIQLDGAPYDWVMWGASAEGERARDLAAEDLGWLARWRDFMDAGLHVAASSDAPWFFPTSGMTDDLARPMDQIAGGMDGRGREFPETPDWMLDDLLTAEEGLRAVTLDAAWALGDEGHRGHLAVGTYGDVTILSGDVTEGTADEIRALDVIATIVGGTTVFCADPAFCP